MVGCILRVSGKAFAAKEFLAESRLVACKVWQVGEWLRPGKPAPATSGFNVVVGDADTLSGQMSEAISFLRQHHADLARLAATAEVDDLVLDFGVPQRDAAA